MNKLKKNSILGKIILIIISLFLGVSLISFNYFAIGRSTSVEGFNVYGLTVEFTGEGKWTSPSANSIKGTVTGTTSSSCGSTSNKKQTGTLTFTYVESLPCIFSFEYYSTFTKGSFKIGDAEKSGSGKYEANLNKDNHVSLSITSDDPNSPTTVNITNITCKIDKKISLTLSPSVNGSYSYNGNLINAEINIETNASTEFTLKAFPNDGYFFNGWNINDTIFSKENPYKGTYSDDATITAVFVRNNSAIFLNNNKEFYNLHDAIDNANLNNDKKIVLSKSGTLFNSSDNIYIFSDGLKFLVPYDDNYEMNTFEDESNLPLSNDYGLGTPVFNYELFIEDKVELIFESNSICYVAAKAWCSTGGANGGGSPSKSCGHINFLGKNSRITMKNGSKLYAYGYITGEGLIDLERNSSLNEFFQISDFKGGTKTSSCLDKVFPFNQFYIQNIESYLQFNGNVLEKVITGFNVNVIFNRKDFKTIFPFISSLNDEKNSGLFKLSDDAVLMRKYDGSTDRINYFLKSGKASISSISLSLAGNSINSGTYNLPIPSNMSLTVEKGATVDVNQDLIFLPGSKLVV